jgi:hypothetical protein
MHPKGYLVRARKEHERSTYTTLGPCRRPIVKQIHRPRCVWVERSLVRACGPGASTRGKQRRHSHNRSESASSNTTALSMISVSNCEGSPPSKLMCAASPPQWLGVDLFLVFIQTPDTRLRCFKWSTKSELAINKCSPSPRWQSSQSEAEPFQGSSLDRPQTIL